MSISRSRGKEGRRAAWRSSIHTHFGGVSGCDPDVCLQIRLAEGCVEGKHSYLFPGRICLVSGRYKHPHQKGRLVLTSGKESQED